jgi:hypothetical protein
LVLVSVNLSLPMWERGLKQRLYMIDKNHCPS